MNREQAGCVRPVGSLPTRSELCRSGLNESVRLRGVLIVRLFELDKSLVRSPEDPHDESESVDLHGLPPDQALRRLAQALHAARVRGRSSFLVITGAGWGNPEQKPVLRTKVEAWLRSPEGRALGVRSVERVHRGGALFLRLQ